MPDNVVGEIELQARLFYNIFNVCYVFKVAEQTVCV